MLKEELARRELPELLKLADGRKVTPDLWPERRKELLDILCRNIYGYTPASPERVTGKILSEDAYAFAGKVVQQKIEISFATPKGEFSFAFDLFLPKSKAKAPVFLHIAFRPDIPDRYTPVEEIIDNGFALALFCYHDVSRDAVNGDYTLGLAGKFYNGGQRRPDEWGRIGVWAYAASRVLDYLLTRDEVDHQHIAVVGHSRLGKTALWTAAQDERFFMAISNNSGFGGAAIAKRGSGERVADFIRVGSWDWYCETFKSYLGKEDENTVYDQHMLLALIASRRLYVASAELDRGADPRSEFLSCYSASAVYRLLGHKGLVTPDQYPEPNTSLHDGEIGYHIRTGTHYFSRYDWKEYMKYFRQVLRATR